jgi:MFS family permease
LRYRDFALLWSGQTFSTLGNFVAIIAMPWQVLQLTGSAVDMGVVVAINLATNVALLLFGGAIVDRVPRRRVLMISDLTSGIVFAAIAWLSGAGELHIEHLYLATVATAATGAFFGPAMAAILPELVPAEILVASNSLRELSRQGGRISGPVVGGILVATAGLPAAFAFDALTFFLSFVALIAMRQAPSMPRTGAGMLQEVREGVVFVVERGWIWVTIAIASVINTFLIAANAVALPVLLKETLQLDATAFGIVFASQGVGQSAGALLTSRLRTRHPGVVMYQFIAVMGFAMLAYAVPVLPAVVAGALAYGGGIVGFSILWDASLQRHVPRELLGRVSSVDGFGSLVFSPIGPLVAGAFVASHGPQPAFLLAGLLTLIASPIGLAVRSVRELS